VGRELVPIDRDEDINDRVALIWLTTNTFKNPDRKCREPRIAKPFRHRLDRIRSKGSNRIAVLDSTLWVRRSRRRQELIKVSRQGILRSGGCVHSD
jgi:hypothetical protein